MHKIYHPSQILPEEYPSIITATAQEAEHLRDLHPDQLNMIYREGWFKMLISKEAGGLGLSLPEVLRLEEALAWADGSTAWVVTLCSGAGWFAGFLQPSQVAEMLSDDRVCFAGSGAVTGIATVIDGGYEISGLWKYASGCLHATIFTANCFIHKDGHAVLGDHGSPAVGTFWFRKEEVQIHHHWNTMGMIATGSHSFEVNGIRVDVDRRFVIDAKHATMKDPVYQYPFLQLAETTLSINLSGMSCRFLDLCRELFLKRIRETEGVDRQSLLLKANEEIYKFRLEFYSAVQSSWDVCVKGGIIPESVWEEVSKHSYALARKSLELVDRLYPHCGLMAADTREEINRVWRNIHTASQHALFGMR